jgi:hypothetical protein
VNESGWTVHGDRSCPRLSATVEKGSDAAGTIPALLNLVAIRIEDAIEHRGVRASGYFQDQCLVEADTGVPVRELSELFGRWRSLPGRQIEHNKIVAGPVHLREIDAHVAKNSRIIPERHDP